MRIDGVCHCLFEQSGTFKNEFRRMGYRAYDYDIQNEFGQTDRVVDLFADIESAYQGKPSVFDEMKAEDLSIAFFPCINFCEFSRIRMSYNYPSVRKAIQEKGYVYATERLIRHARGRERFYETLLKLFAVYHDRWLRMIVENPWTASYLDFNFPQRPSIIDNNRMTRGDYSPKPTAYWFVNCEPTHGETWQNDKPMRPIEKRKQSKVSGVCSAERSMISSDYARNFICDFILGSGNTRLMQQTLF